MRKSFKVLAGMVLALVIFGGVAADVAEAGCRGEEHREAARKKIAEEKFEEQAAKLRDSL